MNEKRRSNGRATPSTVRSDSCVPTSLRSSAPAIPSIASLPTSARIAATPRPTLRLAVVKSSPASVDDAVSRSSAATRTEASPRRRPSSVITADASMDPSEEASATATMLAVPRPRTRLECSQEARPCPWIGCRFHLAIEVTEAERRPTMVSNATTTRGGRRVGLSSSAGLADVTVWSDDVLEALSSLEHTCALDVAEGGASGATRVGALFGMSRQAAMGNIVTALAKLTRELEARGVDAKRAVRAWIDEARHGRDER